MVCALPSSAFAKGRLRGMLRVNTQIDLRSEASDSSDSLGRIPAGTFVKPYSQREEGFRKVSVELEGGETLDGWIREEALQIRTSQGARGSRTPADLPDLEHPDRVEKHDRVVVPQDEAILLHRNPTFLYGLEGGMNYGIVKVANDTSGTSYAGLGFVGGGYIGLFLTPTLPIRLEVMLSQINGTSNYAVAGSTTGTGVNYGFNFLDVAVIPTLLVHPFEFFAGLQYAFGLGLSYAPPGVNINGAGDLSSLGVQGGVGYRFNIGYNTDLSLRLRYELSFQQTPFVLQAIGLLIAIEFQG